MTENDEILEYLMTSDFNENLNKDELKALLIKFREFYRYMYSVKDNRLIDRDSKIKKLKEDIEFKKEDIIKLNLSKSKLENERKFLKERKLTFIERIKGKLDI
tara:strand:- start:329 stop:637 length:309 start_codon:yes stop_codon:yes gene_type:complete